MSFVRRNVTQLPVKVCQCGCLQGCPFEERALLSVLGCRSLCGWRHHQAICNPPPSQNTTPLEGTPPNNTTTAMMNTEGKVLLQTAPTFAYTNCDDLVPVQVLLDNGSQQSYLTNDLRN